MNPGWSQAFTPTPKWHKQAACKGSDPEMFFLPPGSHGRALYAAKAICNRCPVKTECLEAGMVERFGIWGGLSPIERKRLRRNARINQLMTG